MTADLPTLFRALVSRYFSSCWTSRPKKNSIIFSAKRRHADMLHFKIILISKTQLQPRVSVAHIFLKYFVWEHISKVRQQSSNTQEIEHVSTGPPANIADQAQGEVTFSIKCPSNKTVFKINSRLKATIWRHLP